MKRLLFFITFFALAFLPEFVIAETIHRYFMMNELDDGQESDVLPVFEIWDVHVDLGSANPSVKIDAVSFVTETKSGETHVFSWQHNSLEVYKEKAGVYIVNLNGRSNPADRLNVTLTLSSSGKEIETLSGSMRPVLNGGGVMTFRPDRKTQTKNIRLVNPSYSYNGKQ